MWLIYALCFCICIKLVFSWYGSFFQLYNTFYGLGLCLKEQETQELLARPDYSQHQVCWDLLKEAQERIGSAARLTETNKGMITILDRKNGKQCRQSSLILWSSYWPDLITLNTKSAGTC